MNRDRNMKSQYKLDTPKRHNDTIYRSVKLARSIRHDVKKQFKPIYDLESDPEKWNWPIEKKAEELGISIEDYQYALEYLKKHHRIRLGITLFRHENDFLDNWWKNIKLAEKWAIENSDAKLLLQVEREKQMGVKRLFETARIKYPDKFDRKSEGKRPALITIKAIEGEG